MCVLYYRNSEKEYSEPCKSTKETIDSNEQECDSRTIKDGNFSVINAYEEISDISGNIKPVPAFSASTGNITSSPISLKHSSLPCISKFQQIHVCNDLFHLHDSSEESSSKEIIPQADNSVHEGTPITENSIAFFTIVVDVHNIIAVKNMLVFA